MNVYTPEITAKPRIKNINEDESEEYLIGHNSTPPRISGPSANGHIDGWRPRR